MTDRLSIFHSIDCLRQERQSNMVHSSYQLKASMKHLIGLSARVVRPKELIGYNKVVNQMVRGSYQLEISMKHLTGLS